MFGWRETAIFRSSMIVLVRDDELMKVRDAIKLIRNILPPVSYGEHPMAASTKSLLLQALKLPPNDRAALVENLILSLDKPDPSIDAQWLKEAEDRLAAYHAGDLAAVDAAQVFADLGKKV